MKYHLKDTVLKYFSILAVDSVVESFIADRLINSRILKCRHEGGCDT